VENWGGKTPRETWGKMPWPQVPGLNGAEFIGAVIAVFDFRMSKPHVKRGGKCPDHRGREKRLKIKKGEPPKGSFWLSNVESPRETWG